MSAEIRSLQTQHGITSLDHPVVAVSHMERARQRFERLGFVVPPRGRHLEWGTRNHCIMFPQDYLELRGFLDPRHYTAGLNDFLDGNGEGLCGVAFGTIGAQESHDLMAASGLRPGQVRSLKRIFELPEGLVSPCFKLCFPDPRDTLGLLHVVLCEHLTSDLIRQPEIPDHPNDVRAVLAISRAADDLEAVEVALRRFLGAGAVSRNGNSVTLSLPSRQTIRLTTQEIFRATYDDVLAGDAPITSFPGVIQFAVCAIERTAATLAKNTIPFVRTTDGALRVGPKECCGVICDFVAIQI